MQVIQIIFIISFSSVLSHRETELYNNEEAGKIADFSYAAFLGIRCKEDEGQKSKSWICGSSILSHKLTLTAGHCLYDCSEFSSITVSVGREDIFKSFSIRALSFLVHEHYSDVTASNDIALVRLKTPLRLTSNISRVALLEHPPYTEEAVVAGWGLANKNDAKGSHVLKYTTQHFWDKDKCRELFRGMPQGTFCARSITRSSYTDNGDSGSALVVRGYIQLGLVSVKNPNVTTSVTFYTDTGYFHKWIKINSREILCED